MTAEPPDTLSAEEVRKVARLSRLALSDEQVSMYRTQLTSVLRYAARLRDVNLEGVEPMPHIAEETNRLDADEPGTTLSNEDVMKLAPERMDAFIKVPKILGDEGSA